MRNGSSDGSTLRPWPSRPAAVSRGAAGQSAAPLPAPSLISEAAWLRGGARFSPLARAPLFRREDGVARAAVLSPPRAAAAMRHFVPQFPLLSRDTAVAA